jgi:protein-disulfide isomerase
MRSLKWPLTLAVAFAAFQGCASPGEGASEETPRRQEAASANAPDSLVALGDQSRILGAVSAPVWVIIVSDFQCPFCKVWHDETFPALKREFVDNGQIRLAYVNLPLPQHQHARVTAELALCAGAQGKFWEYHDALFDTQAEWSSLPAGTPFFDGLATRAGVDPAQMRSCMQGGQMGALVDADYQRGVEAKVKSTPTFMIGNGIRLQGAQPIESFRKAIADARAGSTTPGTP